jgi:Smr domain
VSRKHEFIKVVNLEDGMPTVEQARLRMEHVLHEARRAGFKAIKLIHGYGSSGAGGALRVELQKTLRQAMQDRNIRAFIAGEDWRISNETTWELLKRFPEWKQDSDLGRNNRGISIVII